MKHDGDFEGLRDRNDEQALAEQEQQRAIEEVLNDLDQGKRLNSGQMLLLRWFCGVPAPKPQKETMSVWNPNQEPF